MVLTFVICNGNINPLPKHITVCLAISLQQYFRYFPVLTGIWYANVNVFVQWVLFLSFEVFSWRRLLTFCQQCIRIYFFPTPLSTVTYSNWFILVFELKVVKMIPHSCSNSQNFKFFWKVNFWITFDYTMYFFLYNCTNYVPWPCSH